MLNLKSWYLYKMSIKVFLYNRKTKSSSTNFIEFTFHPQNQLWSQFKKWYRVRSQFATSIMLVVLHAAQNSAPYVKVRKKNWLIHECIYLVKVWTVRRYLKHRPCQSIRAPCKQREIQSQYITSTSKKTTNPVLGIGIGQTGKGLGEG